MREAAIQIEQVSKSFQERKVLKNISCELNWGQVYGIVGNDRNKESEDPGGSKSQNSGVADQGNHACCRA